MRVHYPPNISTHTTMWQHTCKAYLWILSPQPISLCMIYITQGKEITLKYLLKKSVHHIILNVYIIFFCLILILYNKHISFLKEKTQQLFWFWEKKTVNKQRSKHNNPQVSWLMHTMTWEETEIAPGWGWLLLSSPCAQAESGTILPPKEMSANLLQTLRTAFPEDSTNRKKVGKDLVTGKEGFQYNLGAQSKAATAGASISSHPLRHPPQSAWNSKRVLRKPQLA